jgi:hypothetical protein
MLHHSPLSTTQMAISSRSLPCSEIRNKRAPVKPVGEEITPTEEKKGEDDNSRAREDVDQTTDPPDVSDVEDSPPSDIAHQHSMLEALTRDPDSGAREKDKKLKQMYLSLTASEFLYVRELQRAYDETRCYFCQWVFTKEMKELINSARLTS